MVYSAAMNLEDFRCKYPADASVRGVVQTEKDSGPTGRSLITVLAVALIREGKDGLQALTKRLNPSDIALPPDLATFRALPEEHKQLLLDHQAAIFFGLSIIALEEALVSREFDAGDWCARYNLAVQNTNYPPITLKGEEKEAIPRERWREMIACAEEDKTLGTFFDTRTNLLPKALKGVLDQVGVLPYIRERTLSPYRERARFLVDH